MIYKTTLYSLLLLLLLSCQAQEYGRLTKIATLPSILQENSGIAFVPNSTLLYAINDSGNKSRVFGVDPFSGTIITETRLEDTKNNDWEDLTSDSEYLYVGDFGNNISKRKNLKIHWVPNNLLSQGSIEKKEVAITHFNLEDQVKFPPKKKDRNFDIESFFVLGDYFYLFTRNRSSKFDGTTKLYRLQRAPGRQEARLISSFKTCDDRGLCQVTSADIDKLSDKVALLSYNSVWIFTDYKEDDFFSGTSTVIPLEHISQKESILFKDQNTLIITEENDLSKIGGNIYELSLKE